VVAVLDELKGQLREFVRCVIRRAPEPCEMDDPRRHARRREDEHVRQGRAPRCHAASPDGNAARADRRGFVACATLSTSSWLKMRVPLAVRMDGKSPRLAHARMVSAATPTRRAASPVVRMESIDVIAATQESLRYADHGPQDGEIGGLFLHLVELHE
jgi:hypothetical protein